MIKGILGIHHVALSVPSLEEAEAFYVGLLGMEKIARWDFGASKVSDQILKLNQAAAKTLMLRCGNMHLEIFEFTSPPAAAQYPQRPVCDHGYTHIAFDVDINEIQNVYERLDTAGVTWHSELFHDPQEGLTTTYGRDPFGNVIEIQALSPDCSFYTTRTHHDQ